MEFNNAYKYLRGGKKVYNKQPINRGLSRNAKFDKPWTYLEKKNMQRHVLDNKY